MTVRSDRGTVRPQGRETGSGGNPSGSQGSEVWAPVAGASERDGAMALGGEDGRRIEVKQLVRWLFGSIFGTWRKTRGDPQLNMLEWMGTQ